MKSWNWHGTGDTTWNDATHSTLIGGCIGATLHKLLDPTFEFCTRQQDFALTRQATNPDFGPQPYDAPGIAAAGMWFAHLDNVAEKDRYWFRHRIHLIDR